MVRDGDFIQMLPKAELHLHLEGTVPWEMIQARVPSLPSPPPWWAPEYRFDGFSHFARIARLCYEPTLGSPSDYYLAAQGVLKRLAAQNVRYVELSFSLGHVRAQRLSLTEVVDAIRQAAPADLTVRLFCGFSRSRPDQLRGETVEAVLNLAGIDGLDLHGDENAQAPAQYAGLFAAARRRGLATKAHAGELAGPQAMADAIAALALTRVEHGVRAIEDDQLTLRLVRDAITLDVCPTSNIKLRVVRDVSAHPIRQLYERGVRVTVSSDNPTILGCSLTGELRLLAEHVGFVPDDLVQLEINAFQAALLPPARQTEMLAELVRLPRPGA